MEPRPFEREREPASDDERRRQRADARPRERSGALAGLEALERQPPRAAAPAPGQAPLRRPAPVRPPDHVGWDAIAAPVSATPPMPTGTPVRRHVRLRIRRTGPLLALVLPAVLGMMAMVALRGSTTTGRGVGGFVLALLAAPLLPAFGEPVRAGSGSVLAAAAASAALWFVLGAVAARRATRSSYAGWGSFWAEYLWLCLCVWIGAALAVVAANLVLGRVLL